MPRALLVTCLAAVLFGPLPDILPDILPDVAAPAVESDSVIEDSGIGEEIHDPTPAPRVWRPAHGERRFLPRWRRRGWNG